VQILNCVDGCIPSDMATGKADQIEEERRLLYVAMTRARDDLTLLLPQRFYVRQQSAHGDRHVYAAPSRFLTEAICAHFNLEAWQPQSGSQATAHPPGSTRVDLRALLRDTWTPVKPTAA
jgi:DNA helicase-2/ATP-dependent DNA helicase PcrA